MNSPAQPQHRPSVEGPSVDEQRQYLTFTLGREMFAIGILNVREILEFGQLTTVPMMPEFIRGVINLRGAVVPVVDLAARFGGRPTPVTKRTCIVIIEVHSDEDRHEIGVVVDAVSAVLEIPDSEIEAPPAFGAKIRTDFIYGMGKVDGRFVIILDVGQVLSIEDLAVTGQATKLAMAEESGEA